MITWVPIEANDMASRHYPQYVDITGTSASNIKSATTIGVRAWERMRPERPNLDLCHTGTDEEM